MGGVGRDEYLVNNHKIKTEGQQVLTYDKYKGTGLPNKKKSSNLHLERKKNDIF